VEAWIMTAAVAAGALVAVAAVASHAFHGWLRQRERERFSATDKAELVKRFEAVEGVIRELKGTVTNLRR
jgi:hypothetical protein